MLCNLDALRMTWDALNRFKSDSKDDKEHDFPVSDFFVDRLETSDKALLQNLLVFVALQYIATTKVSACGCPKTRLIAIKEGSYLAGKGRIHQSPSTQW